MRATVALLVILAGCVAPPTGLLEGECSHGICAPDAAPGGAWQPVFRTDFTSDPGAERALPSFMAGNGTIALLDRDGAILQMIHTDPLTVRNVSLPFDRSVRGGDPTQSPEAVHVDDVGLVATDGTWFVLEALLADWDPALSEDVLVAVGAGTGEVHELALPRVYLLDVHEGRLAIAWADGHDEVVGTWIPGQDPVELWRHALQPDRVVGRLDQGGLLVAEHAAFSGMNGTSWERTAHHLGDATWSLSLGRGWGITDAVPAGDGVMVHESSEAYHFRHHHDHAHSLSMVARHGPTGLQWSHEQGDWDWRFQHIGGQWWLAGPGGAQVVEQAPVGPGQTSLALRIDAVDGSLYWLGDGHLWRAPPGADPLPDG